MVVSEEACENTPHDRVVCAWVVLGCGETADARGRPSIRHCSLDWTLHSIAQMNCHRLVKAFPVLFTADLSPWRPSCFCLSLTFELAHATWTGLETQGDDSVSTSKSAANLEGEGHLVVLEGFAPFGKRSNYL
jgi:hypothetical protein